MVIYKITNKINGHCYVGATKQPFRTRKAEHKHRHTKRNGILYKAMREFGWDSFEWEILLEKEDSSDIHDQEVRFIKEYNSFYKNGRGYNSTEGGKGIPSYTFTPVQRNNVSESHKGIVKSEECRKKLSDALKGRKVGGVKKGFKHDPANIKTKGPAHYFYGKTRSNESKKCISDALKLKHAAGVKFNRKLSIADVEQALVMRRQGATFEQIGAHFGVTGDAVWYHAKKARVNLSLV